MKFDGDETISLKRNCISQMNEMGKFADEFNNLGGIEKHRNHLR
jgi:hypothetical protein